MTEYFGDPYSGCRPECVTNSDCDRSRACVNNKCVDPCPGTCGINAECRVINHAPSCSCIPGFSGEPLRSCQLIQAIVEEPPEKPCQPSPCGPYSQCREINNHAVCSCQQNYIGTPPMCRPECIVSSECPQDKACANQKCINPCKNTPCGLNANCRVINHNPICSCIPEYTGDPFSRCAKPERMFPLNCTFISFTLLCSFSVPSPERKPENPCIPSPCGPNSQCRVIGTQPACSCLQNYIGRPPNCRPECINNAECPNYQSCKNERCVDPCPGTCGTNSQCTVVNHNPVCSCFSGYTGDPFSSCILLLPPCKIT